MVHLNGLLRTPNHIMCVRIARHTTNNLVLPWHVQLLEHLVQLLFHFEHLAFKLLDLGVFLFVQKLEILSFGLRLPQCCFPPQVDLIKSLLSLDQLQM